MRRWLPRLVGLVVIGAAAAAGALLWIAASHEGPSGPGGTRHGLVFGVWQVLYDTDAPRPRLLLTALGLALLLAAVVALVEAWIGTRSRRSANVTSTPLSPRVVMAQTRGVHAGPVTVTVLVPAYNEEQTLPATLSSLMAQSRPPERVVVVADNCTDATARVARAAGAEVFETVGNSGKKAGALNQALSWMLPDQGDNDVVMVMDADTMLDDGFLQAAVARFTNDRGLMAVGGLFYGEPGHGLLGQFQRNEYTRYSRDVRRRRGKVFVLTGTASLFRPRALRTVAECRGSALPGIHGDVYDTLALTEDNELTIALKSLGALMISPQQCTVVTELMPSWRTLWAQRLRWQRGALENIGAYGVTPQTVRYWAQQFGIGYGVFALAAYVLMLLLMLLAEDSWVWFPFWVGIGLLFMVERLVTVWEGGAAARITAVLLFPELFYAFFLNMVYVKGVLDITLGRQAGWKHVVRASEDVTTTAEEAGRR